MWRFLPITRSASTTPAEQRATTRLYVVPAWLRVLAGLLALDDWLQPIFVTVFVIAVVSGVQYVWIWSAKARRERLAARLKSH